MNKYRGIAASGHSETSGAAALILEAGGNAFDAVLAALCAACVAEPLLASLGGGGFLLAHQNGANNGARNGDHQQVYDFFCQTPAVKRKEDEIDFYPITADFGPDEQEFHIGVGSMAVPGVVAGIFAVHEDLCRLPLREIVAPAIALARQGVLINAQQAYVARILQPILRANPETLKLYTSPDDPTSLINPGDQQFHRNLADTFEAIAGQGQEWFYQGEPARVLARHCLDDGGHLTLDDLAAYRVERRDPVRFGFRGSQCAINPFPSPGGNLIALTLGVLQELMPDPDDQSTAWGSTDHLLALMYSMHASNLARSGHDPETASGNDSGSDSGSDSGIGLDALKYSRMLDDQTLRKWGDAMRHLNIVSRGTTHISVADEDGNLASLTVSNGEGCSYVLPGTGVMMNNMLGEEDINPEGFNRWRPAQRLASMMSPAVVVKPDGTAVALGTAGSNRIRSAMVQVLANLLAFDQNLTEAVSRPRIHLEDTRLSIEGGVGLQTVGALRAAVPDTHVWPDTNLFFGGVNAVSLDVRGEFIGAADPRREGSVVTALNNQ